MVVPLFAGRPFGPMYAPGGGGTALPEFIPPDGPTYAGGGGGMAVPEFIPREGPM